MVGRERAVSVSKHNALERKRLQRWFQREAHAICADVGRGGPIIEHHAS